jgi:hypothetical protein
MALSSPLDRLEVQCSSLDCQEEKNAAVGSFDADGIIFLGDSVLNADFINETRVVCFIMERLSECS